MAKQIIISKPNENRYGVSTPKRKEIIISQSAGGGGPKGVTFSVEDGHILVLSGKVSVENNDTIVL